MTIKNDRWIRQQCTPPLFEVTEWVAQQQHSAASHMLHPRKIRPHLSEAEIVGRIQQSDQLSSGYKAYRPLSPQEVAEFKPMIWPFEPDQVRYVNEAGEPAGMEPVVRKVISYGTSSMGYDVRLARDFKIFTNVNSQIIDPLDMSEQIYHDHTGDFCIIPPNSYVLGHTVETFAVPNDILILCVGKSTYARAGAHVNVTPVEPGFQGQIVIEISNATNLPLKIHAGMGIAQFLFLQSDEPCENPYGADRKYQFQRGLTTARV